MDFILQTKEVSKDFFGKLAVDHVSISVKKVTYMDSLVKMEQVKQRSCV